MKDKLTEAFRNRLERMPYAKIKITDLCRDCEVNRQTFYYHFKNLNDLAAYFIHSEAETLLGLEDEPFRWEERIRSLITYLDKNRELCLSVLSSMEHRLLRNILEKDTEQLIRRIYESAGSSGSAAAILEMTEEERQFYIKFYSLAVSGLLESYILGEIKISPEGLIDCIKKAIEKLIVI